MVAHQGSKTDIQPQQILEERLLTKKHAAEKLSISTRTLDRMVANGGIQKIFVGGSVRFRLSYISAIQNGGG